MKLLFLGRQLGLLGLLCALQPACAQGSAPAAPSPTDQLPRLLAERRVLTERYAAASAQRHALFGLSNQPSKKDLQQVVDALQGIVDKDSEIVAVLNQTAQQAQTTASTLQNTGRDDRNLSAQRLTELQDELQNGRLRERQAAARQQNLAAELAEAQQSRRQRDYLIAALAVISLALLVGLLRRR
jgi:aspartokinase